MINLRFLNNRAQYWQEKKWIRFDDVTPYCAMHKDMPQKSHQPECVKNKWFNVYCGKYRDNMYEDRSRKLRKFYWNIHPTEWPFKLPRNK